MTKQQLQQELKEKVKEGIKPSHLKRSKSLNDIPSAPPLPANSELITCQKENKELKQKITELGDHILQLRLDRLKDFSAYQEETKKLTQELDDNVNYGVKEIEKLETKLRTVNKKKLELQQQLGETQSKNARLELKLIDEQNKEDYSAPVPHWWVDYGPIILLLALYGLSYWLLSKNLPNHEQKINRCVSWLTDITCSQEDIGKPQK